jgi:hypothetical protein
VVLRVFHLGVHPLTVHVGHTCSFIDCTSRVDSLQRLWENDVEHIPDRPSLWTFQAWNTIGVKFINIAGSGSIYALILIAGLDLWWAALKLIGEVPRVTIYRLPPIFFSSSLSFHDVPYLSVSFCICSGLIHSWLNPTSILGSTTQSTQLISSKAMPSIPFHDFPANGLIPSPWSVRNHRPFI